MKRTMTILLAAVMLLALLAACGQGAQPAPTQPAATAAPTPAKTEAPVPAATEAPAPTEPAATEEPAFHIRGEDEPFTITDMGGRTVSFDHAITKAYAANPMGIVLIETMDFDKLGGYAGNLSEQQKKFIPEKYWDLPNLGAWSTATPTANIEELVNAGIDVILVTQLMTEKVKQMAENIQSQTGIPTVLINTAYDGLADSYILLGELFNDPERGQMLSDYLRGEIAEIRDNAAKVPESEKVTFLYSEGADGLETDPEGSFHTETFTLIGMINVADVAENTTNGFVGQSQISLEQIINWNPQYIIRNFSGTGTSDNVKASDILANPDWAGIRAVQDGHVYQTPALPYNWIDRPPSVIKVLGAKWLGNLVYPEYFDYDIVAEAKEFFRLFYGWELKDEQLNNILAASR